MVMEAEVRSEAPSLQSLGQVLAAIRSTNDRGKLPDLVLLAVELYSDASCRCEEKEASFGEGEGAVCLMNVRERREELLSTLQDLFARLGR